MSEQPKEQKPKLSAEDKAKNSGLSIYKSGFSQGRSEGRKESTDPDAKRMNVLVQGAVRMKAKGKNSTPKQLQNCAINIKDENDYPAIEMLVRKALLLYANAQKPAPKPKTESVPNPPPTA